MTDLSPAAQAVLDAAMQYEINPECYSREIAAAALRAAADQLQMDEPLGETDADVGVYTAHHAIRLRILAIAAELAR
jgi:hypothetical protein